MNYYGQEQAGGVHYDMALAPRYLLAGVVASRPPFSVVLTDWLSKFSINVLCLVCDSSGKKVLPCFWDNGFETENRSQKGSTQ